VHVHPLFVQVLGCHAKPLNATASGSNYSFPRQYPADNGKSCICEFNVAHYCIAACARNIRNHEVRYQYGKGTTIVSCSEGNHVLGCNIMPNAGSLNITECYAWAAKDTSSCECYSSAEIGATCYALCGRVI